MYEVVIISHVQIVVEFHLGMPMKMNAEYVTQTKAMTVQEIAIINGVVAHT